jgi:release factor glutamine methyltransferase
MADSITVEQALAWARATLVAVEGAEPLDAPILLAHAMQTTRVALIARPRQRLTPRQESQFRALIARRVAGEPVAYLLRERAFYDRVLFITPDVLIPRPETEHLVEAALTWARGRSNLQIADAGTGSGAIAVTLAGHLRDAHLWATDVSAAALQIAGFNAIRLGVAARITFLQGDLLEPVIKQAPLCHLIAANLPYIPSADLDSLAVAKYEPRLALDGGPDGLDLIRRLLFQAPFALAEDGLLLMEIGAGQGEPVSELARAAFPDAAVRVLADYAGHDRVVWVQRGG